MIAGGGVRVISAAPCTFVFQPPNASSLPSATVGGTYSERIKVTSGATGTVTFSPSPSAPPPPGLHLVPTSDDPAAAIIVGSPTQPGPRTFIIDAADSVGCTDSVTYAINISVGNACNPPLTLNPPGGSFQPTSTDGNDWQVIGIAGETSPVSVTTSGGPPGLAVGQNVLSSLDDLNVIIPSGAPPGIYTFQITVTDARGCSVTGNYSIQVINPDAHECVIQLSADPIHQVRVGSTFPVTFKASNIGGATCTGPFTVNVGPGLPQVSTTPGSAFTMAGTSGPTGQQFSGAGTIPGGGFAGVSTLFAATTPGLTQIPVTLQFTSGPGKTDVINTRLTIELFYGRNSERLDTTTARILLGQR